MVSSQSRIPMISEGGAICGKAKRKYPKNV